MIQGGRLCSSLKTLTLISEKGRLERLLKVADSEPPCIRALLGALAEEIGKNAAARTRLRASLNPLSRFDFGLLAGLSHARNWQAKGKSEVKWVLRTIAPVACSDDLTERLFVNRLRSVRERVHEPLVFAAAKAFRPTGVARYARF